MSSRTCISYDRLLPFYYFRFLHLPLDTNNCSARQKWTLGSLHLNVLEIYDSTIISEGRADPQKPMLSQ